jgi:hypothetical protein
MRHAVGSRLAYQGSGLHQGPHALLQEEGIALSALDQEFVEGSQAHVVSQEGLKEGVSIHRRQGIEPQLRVVGLAPPAVPVVRPVVDQQEQARCRQALDETVEQRLGLRIQPVQILTDQQQGLYLALAQQHPLERSECVLAALRGIELQERAIRRQGIQQYEERRDGIVEGRVERLDLRCHIGLDGARVLALLQMAIAS